MKHTAQELNQQAKTLAQNYLRTEAQLLLVLMQMRKDRAFAVLGYSGIFEYAEKALHLSRAQAFYFKTVAQKSETVPELKDAVVHGELTLSQARRIAPVLTPDNYPQWIEDAKTLSQPELERKVASANPKAHVKERIRPIGKQLCELRVLIEESTEQDIEVLKDVLSQKLGRPASLQDVVAWAMQVTREKFDPQKKAERAVKAAIKTAEDRRISSRKSAPPSPQPGRHRIVACVKHAVFRRDEAQCAFVAFDGHRCQQRRWLDLHHRVPVCDGGLNTLDNLELRCKAHHALAHSDSREWANVGAR